MPGVICRGITGASDTGGTKGTEGTKGIDIAKKV
jgi:hypothetical protein